MEDFDKVFEAFKQYKVTIDKFIAEDMSEADTRSKMIDELLISVLGWEEKDITREGKVESGFYDYFISIPGVNFIVEAKRNFIDFAIPNVNRKVKIKSLYKSNQKLFDQIRAYAIDKGSQFGILTNGKQIILTKLFNIDGTDWRENTCLLFDSLGDIDSDFITFYDNLSKSSIMHVGGFKYSLPTSSSSFTKILSTLIDREKEFVRNSLSAALSPIIEKAFGEIYSNDTNHDTEFIQKCFVENHETKKNRDEIYRLFADKPPELTHVVRAINTKNVKKQILTELAGDSVNIQIPSPPRPIIIIGTKGAGKTTFINHLINNASAEFDFDQHLVVYVDLRKHFELDNFDPQKIAIGILEDIYEKYEQMRLHSFDVLKQVYFKEIKHNDESTWKYTKENDREKYNITLSEFLSDRRKDNLKHLELLNTYLIRERRKRLVIILDNADQFNQDIQEKVFLFSQSLSRSCLCGVILSLREGYYYKWRNSPPFDAYESNVYHITAPKYSEVLHKRLDYTLEKLDLDKGKSVGISSMGYKMTIPNSSVMNFLSNLKTSLFNDDNESMVNFLSFTTYPNIREGLTIFKQFLISGHTNVEEYIVRESVQNRSITIPIHEFIKSIGLTNKFYYDSEISLIHNLFNPPNETEDHFLFLYILKDLIFQLETRGATGKYVSYSEVFDRFVNFSYRTTTVKDAFIKLMKYNMIDSDDNMNDVEWAIIPSDIKISITAKGHYYFKELITRFHYIDLVLQDTPFYDSDSFKITKASFPLYGPHGKRNLQARLTTVQNFIDYLSKTHSNQPRALIETYGNMIDHIESGLLSDIERIRERIQRL